MKSLYFLLIFLLLEVSCKPKASVTTSSVAADGSWFSICTLGEIEGALLSYDIKINFQQKSFNSVTTYYTDGGCKNPLYSMNKNGTVADLQEGTKKLKSLTINQWLFTLYDAEVVTKYNELSVYKKTWKLGEMQDITSSQNASADQSLWGKILMKEPTNFSFFVPTDTAYADGRLFLKM